MGTTLVLDDTLRPATGPGALCKWCRQPIPETSPDTGRRTRSDALTCSKECRQASWRFGYAGADWHDVTVKPRRFAAADPPYPGMSWRYYRDHPDYAGEVDHRALIDRLVAEYRDGWFLCTSSKTLRLVLALIPADVDVRIGSWTKPSPPRATARGRCAWEPVIFAGGRPRPSDAPMILDWIHAAPPRTYPGRVTGMKPSAFSVWAFNMLGAQPCDALDDLFPGSGAIGRAWDRFTGAETDAGGARDVVELAETDGDASPRDLGQALADAYAEERCPTCLAAIDGPVCEFCGHEHDAAAVRDVCLGGPAVAGPTCPQCKPSSGPAG